MKNLILCCILFIAYSGAQPALCTPPADSLLRAANFHYETEDYRRAISDYQRVIELGHTTDWQVYYNLGNAHFKGNNLGRAIVSFRRAQRLEPNNANIQHNLSVARALSTDRIESVPGFFVVDWLVGVRDAVGINVWTVCFLVLLAVGMLCLLFWQARKDRRFAVYGVVCGCVAVVCYLFGHSAYGALHNENEGVVTNTSTIVRSAPNAKSSKLFILHEGTELEILRQNDNFTEVRISSGDEGWLLSSDIERI